MVDERPTDAETDAIIAELVAAGLVTVTDVDGVEPWTLTPKGAQVGRLLAMSADDGAAVLNTLLDAAQADTPGS